MSPKQKAADFFMKLQSKWEIFKSETMSKKKWPHHLKSTYPGHQLTCRRLICLYICHLRLHKHSHVSPAGFFLGWIWLKYGWGAWEIMEKIWAGEEPSILKLIGGKEYYDDPEKLSRNGERNARYVREALQIKEKLAAFFETPQSKMVARIGACQIYDLERQKHDLKRKKDLYRFIRRLSRFGKKKGGKFSRTKFDRNFSDKSLEKIADLLNQYKVERPGFRYPSQWLDDLASKYKAIRFAECVQAFEKALEISKEVERTKGIGLDRI